MTLKLREILLDKAKLENSHTTIKITIDNLNRPLHRRRVMNTLTSLFLKSDYQLKLSTRLA